MSLCLHCEKYKAALQEVIDAYHFVHQDRALVIRRRANAIAESIKLLEASHD